MIHINQSDCPIITTYEQWRDTQELEELGEEYTEEQETESEIVTGILTLDYCHWLGRLTSGGCIDDGNLSAIRQLRGNLISEYSLTFAKEYVDINSEHFWGD